jgi:hypothetical protein
MPRPPALRPGLRERAVEVASHFLAVYRHASPVRHGCCGIDVTGAALPARNSSPPATRGVREARALD